MRETVVVSEEIFSPFPVCDHLGVSSLAFTVSLSPYCRRCRS